MEPASAHEHYAAEQQAAGAVEAMLGRAAEEIQREKAHRKKRAEDERLRRELEQADPEKFKRLVRPLFRSSKTEGS